MDANLVPSIKCVLIGDYDVGKTSLINTFATREPLNSYFPGLSETIQVHVEHVFRLYLLNIHDTEGVHPPSPSQSPAVSPGLDEPEEIHLNRSDKSNSDGSPHGSKEAKLTSRRVEYGLADVILVCFSLANRTSFDNIETVWCNELRRLCPHVPFVVVGCKLDLRRPDPTTPALVRSPRQTQSSKFPFRRPKFTRSSTASTLGSDTPGSPGSPASDIGHPKGESSSTQPTVSSSRHSQHGLVKIPSRSPTKPVGILTNNTPPGSFPGTSDTFQAPSDTEGSGKNLISKASFSMSFPRAKVFRRKSTLDVPILPASGGSSSPSPAPVTGAAPHPTTRSKTPQQLNISAAQSSKENDHTITGAVVTMTPTSTTNPTAAHSVHTAAPTPSPTRSRHVNLPPFMRSMSHATVFRRILNRSRSRTGAQSGGQQSQSNQEGQKSRSEESGTGNAFISPTGTETDALVPWLDSVPVGGASGAGPEAASAKKAAGAIVGDGSATGPGTTRLHDKGGSDDSAEGANSKHKGTSSAVGTGSAGEEITTGSKSQAPVTWSGAERPALVQRFTSGSADDGSTIMKIHSHIRTNSQPEPSPITSPLSSPLGSDSVATTTVNTPPLTIVSPATHSHRAGPPSSIVQPSQASPPRRAVTVDGIASHTGPLHADGGSRGPTSSSGAKGKGRDLTNVPVASDLSQTHSDDQTIPPAKISPTRKQMRIEEPHLPPRHRPSTTSYQEARSTARLLGASGYIECSALTLVNVVDVFDLAVSVAVERRNASASSLHRHSRRNEDCIVS